ncbi:MAG TPA: hypothetical protein VLC06_02375 [Polyangia bacterium]|nr:hypothetical protein [Polyangia bacterium]
MQRRSTRTVLAVALAVGLLLGAGGARAAPVEDLDDPPIPAPAPAASTSPAAATPPTAPAASPGAAPRSVVTPVAPAPVGPVAPARAAPPVAPAPPPPPSTGPFPWPLAVPAAGSHETPLSAAPPAPPLGASPPQLDAFMRRTKVGAYGQVQLFVDGESNVNVQLPLAAFLVEHRPSDWVRIAASVQVEDGTSTGMQQALVEVAPYGALGLRAGLLIMPIGLGNLSPEPTSYLTVDRPLTDQLIVPSVWRELGIGIFGQVVPGLRYEGAVVSGLDGTGLSAGAPLWGTRGDGSSIAVHDAALVGRVELDDLPPGLIVGGGGYTGGASHGVAALSGLRVAIAEGDLRYHNHGLDLRAEYARVWIIDSYLANDYFGLLGQSAVPSRARGFYLEAGYDLLRLAAPESGQELVLFGGYENVDPRSEMSPYNYNPPAITGPGQLPPEAPSPSQGFARGGIDYRPLPSIALKLDVQVALDGEGPAPTAPQMSAGAQATPRPIGSDVAAAARGVTRVGLALAFNF